MKILLTAILLTVGINAEDALFTFMKQTTYKQAEKILDQSGDSQCVTDLKIVLQAAKEEKLWALKMLDSASKPGSGLLAGNTRDSGAYDQCLKINHDGIRGRYCVGAVTIAESHLNEFNFSAFDLAHKLELNWNRVNRSTYLKEVPMTVSVCMPESCKEPDINRVSNYTELYYDSKLHFAFPDEYCREVDPKPLRLKDILAIIYFATVAIVVVLSTIYDIYMTRNGNKKEDIFIAFSAYTNCKKLYSVKIPEGNISSINGIRVFSLAWVILGHEFLVNCLFPNYNSFYVFEWQDKWENVVTMSAPLAVDTFFAIGGLLLVYLFLDYSDKGIKTSWPMFYIHRILRLTPTFYTCVLVYSTLLSKLGDGPYWFLVEKFYEENCNKYWWASMLYIQNYYNPVDQCVTQSWYLAVDTQIYFLSPILLIPLLKWPKQTIAAAVVVFGLSCAYAFTLSYVYEIGAMPTDVSNDFYKKIYMPTHIRITVWLIGAVWGYALFKLKNRDIYIPKVTLIVIWTIFIVGMAFIMSLYILMTRAEYNVLTGALFNAFAKPAWAMGVCWLIFACIKGYGGIINDFLSIRPFVVLARLNYSMYMVHLIVMTVITTSRRNSNYLSNLHGYFEFWSYYVWTVFLSTIWTLCFESPIITLEKILFKRGKSKKNESKGNINNAFNGAVVELTLQSKGEEKL